MASTKYQRVRAYGVLLDRYTYQAFAEADARFYKHTRKHLIVLQGSYNRGGVSASAGTHDGGGAIDLSVRNLSATELVIAVKLLRQCGFAAEIRYAPPFSSKHIHCIQLGNTKVAPLAASQQRAYLAGRNGLAGNGPGTLMGYRPKKAWVYREPSKAPVRYKVSSDGAIKQRWGLPTGKTAVFRLKPAASSDKDSYRFTAPKGGAVRDFDWYAIVNDTDGKRRKYLRTTESKRWTNSAPWRKL